MFKYKKVSFRCPVEGRELISDFLLGLDAMMVASDEPEGGEVMISADFAEDICVSTVIERLRDYASFLSENMGIAGIGEIRVEEVDTRSWQLWKQELKTVKAGRRVVVRPPWEQYVPRGDEVVIEINPSRAFGTGHHETTSLCIGFIEEEAEKGAVDSLLDIGSGSGILSIAALKLGIKEACGVDIDPVATKEARENAQRNSVARGIRFITGTIEDVRGEYDLVVANVNLESIINMAPSILDRLRNGGRFIASGIPLSRRGEALSGLLKVGFVLLDERVDGQWIGFLFGAPSRGE